MEADDLYLFRAKLKLREDFVEEVQKNARQQVIQDIQKKYTLTFVKLDIEKFDLTCLSHNQVYIMVTPVTLYLWLGREVEKVIITGSLHIIKAFCCHFEKLAEKFSSLPSY